jgi:anti-anti-sigma factor
MDVATTTESGVATLAITGTIDTRASAEFEKALAKAVEGSGTRAIVDFARVDLITSAGIRVLVMFAKRLHSAGGGLALCALTPDVQRVFEISGLTTQFKIAVTRGDALALLRPPEAASTQARGSRVSRLVGVLLGGREPAGSAGRRAGSQRSPLSAHVAELLGENTQPRK